MESCDINASRDDKDGNFGLVFRMSDVMGQYAPAAGATVPSHLRQRPAVFRSYGVAGGYFSWQIEVSTRLGEPNSQEKMLGNGPLRAGENSAGLFKEGLR
jgi:hypothetical protein